MDVQAGMNLPKLLANTKEIQLTPIAERTGSIIAYRRILVKVIRTIRKAVNEAVLPYYTSTTLDSVQDRVNRFTVVKSLASIAINTAEEDIVPLFNAESTTHLFRVIASVKKNTGIDVAPQLALSQDEIEQLVRLYINNNAALIKSLSDDLIYQVEREIYQAKIDRTTYKELTEILKIRYGIAANRAALIATDQLASINADFTESRHLALSITSYRWRHRFDGKVRPLHFELGNNNTIYKWGEPTGAEGGLPPGKPVRCRCTAVPIIPANEAAVAQEKKLKEQLTKSNAEARAKAKRERENRV